MAVTALKGLHHRGNGEGQQEKPDDDGNLRGFLQYFDKVSSPEVHHIEVAVDGQGDEKSDAGSPVEEQHEEHSLAHDGVIAAPQIMVVVVGFNGETHYQQEIGDYNVEQEDTFVLPELEPGEEV